MAKTTTICIADLHMPYEDKVNLDLALTYAKDTKPNNFILLGDVFDLYMVSTYSKGPGRMTFNEEIEYTKQRLAEIKAMFTNKTKVIFVEGNHEDRLKRYIQKNAPAFNNLKELTVQHLLDTKKLGIKYIDNKERLSQYKPPLIISNTVFLHGHEGGSCGGVYPARSMYLKYNTNMVYGHLHRSSVFFKKQVDHTYKQVHGIGCMGRLVERDFSVLNDWNASFIHIETKRGSTKPIFKHKYIFDGQII